LVDEEAWKSTNPASIKKMMNDEWEHGIKRCFDGSERTWNVRLPYELTPNRDPGLKLTRLVYSR